MEKDRKQQADLIKEADRCATGQGAAEEQDAGGGGLRRVHRASQGQLGLAEAHGLETKTATTPRGVVAVSFLESRLASPLALLP